MKKWISSSMCWDRAPSVKPDSTLYWVQLGLLYRLDLTTSQKSTPIIELTDRDHLHIERIVSTPTGHLIFSTLAGLVYAFNPTTTHLQPLDWISVFDSTATFVLCDLNRTIVTVDANCITPIHFRRSISRCQIAVNAICNQILC